MAIKQQPMLSYLFYLVIYPGLLLVSIFLGRRTANRSHKKGHQWKPVGVENGLMGFYGLLISFTLVQSANHAKERSDMSQRLADELSALLRITQTQDPGVRAEVRHFVFESYNIMQAPQLKSDATAYATISRVEEMDRKLDKYLMSFMEAKPQSRTEIINLMVKIDNMESVAYRILHSYHRKIPVFVLFILVLYSLLMGFMMGFISHYYKNHIHISTTIFVVISFVTINFIHDMDSPGQGFIRPNYQDIADVIKMYLDDGR